MAFTTRRGRPRTAAAAPDLGTAELRRHHQQGITAEPLDLCLARQLISDEQHRAGLHWRWLYTLRYGAPSITGRYGQQQSASARDACETWQHLREQEYHTARRLLVEQHSYDPIMRLCIHNERPAFLSVALQQQAWHRPALAQALESARLKTLHGLDVLAVHWKHAARGRVATPIAKI